MHHRPWSSSESRYAELPRPKIAISFGNGMGVASTGADEHARVVVPPRAWVHPAVLGLLEEFVNMRGRGLIPIRFSGIESACLSSELVPLTCKVTHAAAIFLFQALRNCESGR